jgi:hypothetical protein
MKWNCSRHIDKNLKILQKTMKINIVEINKNLRKNFSLKYLKFKRKQMMIILDH